LLDHRWKKWISFTPYPRTQTGLFSLCSDFLHTLFMKILIRCLLEESSRSRWFFLWYKIRIFIVAPLWSGFITGISTLVALCEFQNDTSSGVPWGSSRQGICKSMERRWLRLAWCFLHCITLSAKDICYLLFSSMACVG